MPHSTLFPPNSRQFSNAVIGSVAQRKVHGYSTPPLRTERKVAEPHPTFTFSRSGWPADEDAVLYEIRLPSITGHKRLLSHTLSGDTSQSEVQKTKAASAYDDLNTRYTAEIEHRRQRNRMHQARYKIRQCKLVEDLQDTVQKLKEEVIPELEL
ncbi:hypothetical protein GN958_ATG20156 [Phytophthora infestans]|uniref:BZIP domain-containing protein n=1 Tax=Phytophthora infestans TaxID=4787 RepID=A0A8S9TT52_PHYIN|nr:hypothetical protein GN958_ATG20156 [Phytophthora infestans]